MEVIIKGHASFEAKRRGIKEELIKSVVEKPRQRMPSKKGRIVVQSRYYDEEENKEMLLRIIGAEAYDRFEVITVYKTSKISKYWK